MKESREAKAKQRIMNLQAIFDNEVTIEKVMRSRVNLNMIASIASNIKKKVVANPATEKIKRAKKRAICQCYLHKAHSSLTENEKLEKKKHFLTIKMYNEILSGGEFECQLLVDTASDAQPFSPESVSSEMIHSVVLNMSEY